MLPVLPVLRCPSLMFGENSYQVLLDDCKYRYLCYETVSDEYLSTAEGS